MTEARLECGSCGFEIIVRARTDDAERIVFELEGGCPALAEFASRLPPYDPYTDGRTLLTSSVYAAAEATIKHVDCMVPAAVIRAGQVQAGVALPHTVTLHVERK